MIETYALFEKIRNLYYKLVPYHLRPGELWYRLKCFLWKRFTTVKPRYLPHTWCDRSHLLPHMMFEILSQFVEKECGADGIVNWYSEDCPLKLDVNGISTHARDEMQALYDWWHKDYIKNVDNVFSEWYAFVEKHEKNEWKDHGEDFELISRFDSVENETEAERLFKEAQVKEENYDRALKEAMHRIVNVSSFMWT